MYLNLNAGALGISGRQSELIELALTYRFKGMDLDMAILAKQVDMNGFDHATRFITSANISIGEFDLPVRWQGDDTEFHEDLEKLSSVGETAAKLSAVACRTVVMPASNERPYHENFEFHRERFTKIAEALSPHGIRLGLDFLATPVHRDGIQHQFIHSPDAIVTLAKTVGVDNVGVAIDLWQWQVAGGNWDLLRGLSSNEIVSVRVADVPAGVATATIDDSQRILPADGGTIDMSEIVRHLHEVDYKGPVTPYPHASQFSGVTRDAIVRKASNSIRLDAPVVMVDEDPAAAMAGEEVAQ